MSEVYPKPRKHHNYPKHHYAKDVTRKVCPNCGLEKPLASFNPCKAGNLKRVTRCKTCDQRHWLKVHKRSIVQLPLFILSKVCSTCKQEKPIDCFERSNDKKYGYGYQCMGCRKLYREREQTKARRQETTRRYKYQNSIRESRRRASTMTTEIDAIDYGRVRERAAGQCYICEGPILPDHPTHFDHVVPLTRKGTHTQDNIRLVHKTCNLRKHNYLISEMSAYSRRGIV